jgi:hypothetical protein
MRKSGEKFMSGLKSARGNGKSFMGMGKTLYEIFLEDRKYTVWECECGNSEVEIKGNRTLWGKVCVECKREMVGNPRIASEEIGGRVLVVGERDA